MKKQVNNELYNQAYQDEDNRKIISSVLSKYAGKLDPDTLKSCGLKGLWRALENHDAVYSTKFTSSLWRFTRWACATELKSKIEKKEKNKVISSSNDILDMCKQDCYEAISTSDTFNDIDSVLNKEQSKIVRMRFIDNMTLEEIGQNMGFTKETARQKLKLALSQIKDVVYNDIEERN